MKGRNCAPDVCWEERKFRMICSHLTPLSVMHLYAKDLGDHRVEQICTSIFVCTLRQAWGQCHQDQLANIGTATTVSHRVEKQRMFESFIMENLLTLPILRMTVCNFYGNHEPQQTNYILYSGNSLRSRTFDASATKSDHWELIAIKSKHVKAPLKRTVRKLNGWECRDRIGVFFFEYG